MTNIVNGHDLDTQSGRADFRASGGWVEGNSSGGGYSYQTPSGQTGSGGGTQTPTQGAVFNTPSSQQVGPTATVSGGTPTQYTSADPYIKAIQQAVQALNSSDLKAFNEQVREWDKVFQFNTDQFNEGIRQFNNTFGLNQANVTGVYNGAPTLEAATRAANFLGTYQGQQTLQAQNQYFNQALAAAGLTGRWGDTVTQQAQAQAAQLYGFVPVAYDANGVPVDAQGRSLTTLAAQQQAYAQQMGAIQAASQLQANPFRQAQVIGQASRLLAGQPTAAFSAPNTVGGVGTVGGNTQGGVGYLQQLVDDIKNPGANQTTADQFIASTPTPNKLDSTSFLRAAPSTQNIVLQAMQEKYGIDPNDALTQIRNTLPQFTAPTTFGGVRR